MAGVSCEKCIFSVWQDQSQTGCSLGRVEKYPHAQILNEDKNGFYYVLTKNICPAKRDKSWLSKNSQRPDKVVRNEVYPKIQLFLIINSLTNEWINFFAQTDLSKYNRVDVCLFLPEGDYVKSIGYLLNYNNIFIHTCLGELNWTINHFVVDDCQYYVQFDKPDVKIDDLPNKLDYYLNDQCKSLVMIRPMADVVSGLADHGLLVSTYMHNYVGGYGSQSVEEKIYIDCVNHNNEYLVLSAQEFYHATTP